MKHNLEHFSEIMDKQLTEEVQEIGAQSDMLYEKLTADMTKDISSTEIQAIVHELLTFIQKNSTDTPLDKPYINMLIDTYSNDYMKNRTDNRYGAGASDYIVKAFRYYSENNAPSTR